MRLILTSFIFSIIYNKHRKTGINLRRLKSSTV
nr:MAG TPA: hypothetical protein [Caudoviricetes sp.]